MAPLDRKRSKTLCTSTAVAHQTTGACSRSRALAAPLACPGTQMCTMALVSQKAGISVLAFRGNGSLNSLLQVGSLGYAGADGPEPVVAKRLPWEGHLTGRH